jgi:hypothetical protein
MYSKLLRAGITKKQLSVEINKSLLEDKIISIAIMSSFVVLTLQYLILVYFNLLDTPSGSMVQLTSKVLVGFFYLIALPAVLRRSKIKLLTAYCVSIFIFGLNYLFFDENWPYITSIIFPFFFTCLPTFIYSFSIRDWTVLKRVMKNASLLVFAVGLIIGLLVFTSNASVGTYSMSLSYYMLLPAIVYMDEFLDKFTIRSMLITSLSLLIILALGSRGAIMCIGLFIALKLVNMGRTLNYKTIFIYFLAILTILFMWFFFETIMETLYDVLLEFGIRSRSIQLFLREEVHLSGRDSLYETLLEEIADNPLFGVGLAGDRLILGGRYVHNVFIEIFANYGVVFGFVLIVLLFILIFNALFFRSKQLSSLITIWFCIGFVHLIVSSSYLIDFKFWIFLGLASKISPLAVNGQVKMDINGHEKYPPTAK